MQNKLSLDEAIQSRVERQNSSSSATSEKRRSASSKSKGCKANADRSHQILIDDFAQCEMKNNANEDTAVLESNKNRREKLEQLRASSIAVLSELDCDESADTSDEERANDMSSVDDSEENFDSSDDDIANNIDCDLDANDDAQDCDDENDNGIECDDSDKNFPELYFVFEDALCSDDTERQSSFAAVENPSLRSSVNEAAFSSPFHCTAKCGGLNEHAL